VCKRERGMYIYIYRNEGAYCPPQCRCVCVCVNVEVCVRESMRVCVRERVYIEIKRRVAHLIGQVYM